MIRLLHILFFVLMAATPLVALEKVSVQLKWHHQFQFAGYYAAVEQGYYAAEGLDVTLIGRDKEKNHIEQVIHGEAEYGIADSVLLLYMAKKKPIVIVAPIFQHSPNVLITLKKSGIDSPYKLAGKTISFYHNDADGLGILAMLHEMQMDKKFKLIPNTFNINDLIEGKVDAYPGYITNEPYTLLKSGADFSIINPQHFGVDLYGDMLFTTQDELKNHPERVAAMKRATLKGWQYALSHKDEMVRLITTKYGSPKTTEHLLYEANGIESMISPATIPLGTLDKGRIEYIQNLLRRHGLISDEILIDRYIYQNTQTFNLTPSELSWLKEHPVIRLAIDTRWEPFEYVDSAGAYRGIASEYISLISQKLGVRFEPYTQGVWSEAVQMLKNRELDMFPCAVQTPQREQFAVFTSPYLNFRMAIMTDNTVDYVDGISGLDHKTVAVTRGYYSEEVFEHFYPYIRLLKVDTINEGLEAVSSGKAYAFVDNLAAVTFAIQNEGYSNLKISGELPHTFQLAMGIRNDWPELAGIIQKAIDSITPEERDAIYNRYLKIEYTQNFTWSKILQFIVPLGMVILILLYYTRKQHHLNRALRTAFNNLSITQKELEKANEKLLTLSSTDQLTSLANRRHLDETLRHSIEYAKRYDRPLSVILVDLDFFKHVNDTYGHEAGDEVLRRSAAVFRRNTRAADTIGRWGGEEFLILCPETQMEEALVLAEKLRSMLSIEQMPHDHLQTASFGVCEYDSNDPTPEHLVRRADDALYAAKAQGRNSVRPCLND